MFEKNFRNIENFFYVNKEKKERNPRKLEIINEEDDSD